MPTRIIRPPAEADLEDIWFGTWEKWGPRQADKYLEQLRGTFALLGERPGLARPLENRPPFLRYTAGKHTVILLRNEEAIEIIRVLHGRMNTEDHL